jgi:hypothetical protein
LRKGYEELEAIISLLQTALERGFIERAEEEDELTVYMLEQGLIRKLPTEGTRLYEVTENGKRFFALVMKLKEVVEKFVANGNQNGAF